MPIHSAIRTLSLVITGVLALAAFGQSEMWLTWVYGFGFSHYYLSLWYSRKQLANVLTQPVSWLPLAIVILLGTVVSITKFSLVVYFGFHHAFNEVYLLNKTVPREKERDLGLLRTAAVFLNLFVYLFVLRHTTGFARIDATLLLLPVIASYVVFVYVLSRARASMTSRELLDNTFLEVLGLVFVALSFFVKVRFTHVVMFHFIFWALAPVPKMLRAGTGTWARYALATLAILVPVFVLSPFGIQRYPLKGSFFESQFYFWSYFHITASLALSAAHPRWITKWFAPAPRVGVPTLASAGS